MILTARVKLKPASWQAPLLMQVLETANRVCNFVSEKAWESQTFSRFKIHKLVYFEAREKFELNSQITLLCIAKVAHAYKTGPEKIRQFKRRGTIHHNHHTLNWRTKEGKVSIWTFNGRQTIPFAAGPRQLELLSHQKGETGLEFCNGEFYLLACCEIDKPAVDNVTDILGVDSGIVNIATDSDGNVYSSGQLNGIRHRHRRLRGKLQKKGTQSAKRLLKKRSGKESRFAKNVNHTVSKRIVATAKGTGRGIALEDLGGIRDRITVRKSQRVTLYSWSFHQLRAFIEYKAERAGVPVFIVDPRNTSRTCPKCLHVDKANRPNQSTFKCVACGFSGLADHIAAENIRVRGRAACRTAAHPAPA